MNINYKKSARYDDLHSACFKSQSSVKIEFDCEIYNELDELLTNAQFILVFVLKQVVLQHHQIIF
jgi:acyl-CoA thioester hydrolase